MHRISQSVCTVATYKCIGSVVAGLDPVQLESRDTRVTEDNALGFVIVQERPAIEPLALHMQSINRLELPKCSLGECEVLGIMGLLRKTRKT